MAKKKANQPWTKINTLSGACIIFSLSLCKYVSKSSLKYWAPPFLIAHPWWKWTHFQMCWGAAVCSVLSGTCSCSASLILKNLSSCRSFANTVLERTLTSKKETKRSKGVKMTSFSLLLSMDCPKQWWEPCLRRSWMHSLSCGPAHPTLCCSCSTPQTPRLELLNPLPSDQTQPLRSPVSLFRGQHTPCGALWTLPLANLGGNSQVLLQIWQATGSA